MQVFCRVFFRESLSQEFLGDLRAVRLLFGVVDELKHCRPFLFSVKIRHMVGGVVRLKFLADAPIAAAGHIAGGKMQQAGMV